MLEAMRTEGVPPPACQAVIFGALRYLNAELLNALVLRRDCCSTSAVKALKVLTHSIAFIVQQIQLYQLCRSHGVEVVRLLPMHLSPFGRAATSFFERIISWQLSSMRDCCDDYLLYGTGTANFYIYRSKMLSRQ